MLALFCRRRFDVGFTGEFVFLLFEVVATTFVFSRIK
jgi:hypothetical protein